MGTIGEIFERLSQVLKENKINLIKYKPWKKPGLFFQKPAYICKPWSGKRKIFTQLQFIVYLQTAWPQYAPNGGKMNVHLMISI